MQFDSQPVLRAIKGSTSAVAFQDSGLSYIWKNCRITTSINVPLKIEDEDTLLFETYRHGMKFDF
jgi:hypothetical protein